MKKTIRKVHDGLVVVETIVGLVITILEKAYDLR